MIRERDEDWNNAPRVEDETRSVSRTPAELSNALTRAYYARIQREERMRSLRHSLAIIVIAAGAIAVTMYALFR